MDELTIEWLEAEEAEDVMNEIMKRYGQDILQLVYSYVNDKTIAEDLTQDIFVKCYKSLHMYTGKSSFKTWLWRIAINHCKDFLKSWYNKNVMIAEEESAKNWSRNETVEQAVIQKDEDARLAFAVMSLPIKYREVIILFYFEELPIKEISAVLEVNENTIKTRLKKAKELLKERLGE
ncbi:MAG: sigma-70 family RNA polymerase sigma factor [Bacillus sp. (in: firmicutes)]